MASEVEICNRALAYVGANPVLSLNEGTVEASVCKRLYPSARDEVLAAHEWSVVRAQQELPQSLDAPELAFYNAAYRKPSDASAVLAAYRNVSTRAEYDQWDVVGEYVYVRNLSQTTPVGLWVDYLRVVTDPTLFGPMLTSVIVARLAAELAVPLTESERTRRSLWQLYESKLAEALGADGVQGRTQKTFSSELTGVRGRRGSAGFVTGPPLDFS